MAALIDLLGSAQSRSAGRSVDDFERAYSIHCLKGRALTSLPKSEVTAVLRSPATDWTRWRFMDVRTLSDGVTLPRRFGVYGFFNLAPESDPLARVLYIGKTKNLRARVTQSHQKFSMATRCNATHVGYISVSIDTHPSAANYLVSATERVLIQRWCPYLNIEENFFNFQVEPLLPNSMGELWT